MVVLYHTAGVHVYHHPDLKSAPLVIAALFGGLGVSLFFVISGFCIANAAVIAQERDASVLPFFQARLRRIFPPYWFALLFYVVLIQLTRQLVQRGLIPPNGFVTSELGVFNGGTYALNLSLTQLLAGQASILPVSWTLCYELAFYLLVGLLLFVTGKRGGRVRLLRGLHILTLTCLLALVLFRTKVPYPFNLWPQFGLGVLVYDGLARPGSREVRLWGAVIVLASALAAGVSGSEPRLMLLVSLVFASALMLLHRFDVPLSQHPALRWASWVGLFSYSLYLTHFYVLRIVMQVWEKIPLPDPTGAIGLLAGTLGSVAVASLFYRFFEKPFLKKRPKKAAEAP